MISMYRECHVAEMAIKIRASVKSHVASLCLIYLRHKRNHRRCFVAGAVCGVRYYNPNKVVSVAKKDKQCIIISTNNDKYCAIE